MKTIVSLRLETSEASHEEVLGMFPESRIDSSWRKGDMDFRGHPETSYGINVLVAEDETWASALSKASRVILALPNAFKRLRELEIVGELDFGIDSEPQAVERSATLTPEAMAVFSHAGLAVRVSFYSVTEEED